MKKIKNIFDKVAAKENRWLFLSTIFFGIIIGLIFSGIGGGSGDPNVEANGLSSEDHDHSKGEIWTCSMHPQIRQPKFGKCPLCGMDLIPIEANEEDVGPGELKLSRNAIKLAEVRTKFVEKKFVSSEIRMVGKIDYDETNLRYISLRVPGRIDRLFVDFTGTRVRKGDHLVHLYSPELLTAQQELIQSVRSLKRLNSHSSDHLKNSSFSAVEAVREKLRLWGLPAWQIKKIEESGKATDHLVIYSPVDGIVIHKNAIEGIYVKTGSKIYTIADLSNLWIKLDAYESDLPWIRYGQEVEFETEAYPGEVFTGKIAFIDPILNPKTRTVKVRVNIKNTDNRLKPEMFVRAVLRSKLSGDGKVMDPDLAGKWISPMHPEIVKDHPGKCDVCGMPLVRAEELGYLSGDENNIQVPIVIPSTAPMITGARAVVYVEVEGKEGVFSGREIVLGPKAGEYYIVKKGLMEGEKVVVNGAFKIDSDLQIQAKPSMMNPSGGGPIPGHNHGDMEANSNVKDIKKIDISNEIPKKFRLSIDNMATIYFKLQDELSRDSIKNIGILGESLKKVLKKIDMGLLDGESHMEWMKIDKILRSGSKDLIGSKDIEASRKILEMITVPTLNALKFFGSTEKTYFKMHCPMAFDNNGAFWLQKDKETRNPYFGESMLTCKDSIEEISTGKKKK